MEWNGDKAAELYELALPVIREEAEIGDARAQYLLGLVYEQGKAVEEDFDEAREWLVLAADQDEADAQTCLEELETIEAQRAVESEMAREAQLAMDEEIILQGE